VTSTGLQRALRQLKRFTFASLVLPMFWADAAYAQAKLRLTDTALGPISIVAGANGATQTIEAYNVGAGSLALTFASNATWLAASVGATRPCQVAVQFSACLPINVALNTASFARGVYTGAITVRDPNAIDAPQTISVTVQIGGGIPDTIFLYTPPNGGSDTATFATNSVLTTNATTASGGNWLTIAYEGQGSFRFVQPYRITGRHIAGMPEGTYNGTIQLGGSAFPADNKSVQTRLVVTSQPIAFADPASIVTKVRQSSEPTVVNVGVGNRGSGTLTLASVASTMTNGTGWLSAALSTTFAGGAITLTPGALTPGTYRGRVSFTNNSINTPTLTIPVEMEVVASPTPTISFGGIVNNSTFPSGPSLGVGTIASLYGEFLGEGLSSTTGAPLATTLGGVRVLIMAQPLPSTLFHPGRSIFKCPLKPPVAMPLFR